jgi:hypothetical protein
VIVEVPAAAGPAGIKLVGVTPKDHAQFAACIADIEEYSRHLIRDFESTTSQIQSRLSENGSVALRALTMLGGSCGQLEALSVEFEKIDTIQSELVLLSELIMANVPNVLFRRSSGGRRGGARRRRSAAL